VAAIMQNILCGPREKVRTGAVIICGIRGPRREGVAIEEEATSPSLQ